MVVDGLMEKGGRHGRNLLSVQEGGGWRDDGRTDSWRDRRMGGGMAGWHMDGRR